MREIIDVSVTDVLMTQAAANGYSHPRPLDPGMLWGPGLAGGVGTGRIQEMLVTLRRSSGAAEQAESPVVEISETGNRARSHPTCGNTHTPRPPPAAGPGKITSIAVSIEQSAADVDQKDQPVCLFRVPRSGLMADSCDISWQIPDIPPTAHYSQMVGSREQGHKVTKRIF